jgi:hypothetical protein
VTAAGGTDTTLLRHMHAQGKPLTAYSQSHLKNTVDMHRQLLTDIQGRRARQWLLTLLHHHASAVGACLPQRRMHHKLVSTQQQLPFERPLIYVTTCCPCWLRLVDSYASNNSVRCKGPATAACKALQL